MSNETSRQAIALELWQRYFQDAGHDPFQEDDYGRVWCVFCGGLSVHDDDCVYVAAEKLVAEGK